MLISTEELLRAAPFAPPSPAAGQPNVHLVDTREGPHAFVVNGSRIYGIATEAAAILRETLDAGDPAAVDRLLGRWGVTLPPLIDDCPVVSPPLRSLSLAIAQKCNLGCTYCYAQQGEFGGDAQPCRSRRHYRRWIFCSPTPSRECG
jgi:uncharacterized protein